jgi:hypothetical protein
MSPYRTLSDNADASAGGVCAGEGCEYLPPRGVERRLFLGLVALLAALKVLTIYHFRVDTDETQHAHVVWGWATGRLQYRDLFDNHMPLFQMLCAPLMKLLGERADIIVMLRWAMVPLYVADLWCIFRLTALLYSRRMAPWVCLAAAALPKFFYTATEFRPDDLWALFWLLALLVAVSGRFTWKRAFGFGLMLGLTFAVSMKTVVLLAGLLTAVLVALGLAWARREGPGLLGSLGRVVVIVAGAVIPPALVVLYFVRRQAFWIMYYGVVSHNVVPRMKRWGHFSMHVGIYPAAVVVLGIYAWLIFRQTKDTRLVIRRTIILLTPWFFLTLLLSYWPDITREDDVPYVPLTPLLLAPALLWVHGRFKMPRIEARFFTWILPAICFAEMIWVWNANTLRSDRMKDTVQSIHDVLLLTGPEDYVMDSSGDYVFRMRPYYWVFETITKARIRLGLIKDDLPKALVAKETPLCNLFSARVLPEATRFMLENYMPFDPKALDLGAAGKELGTPDAAGRYSFDVAIAREYAVVSESGTTAGMLDGAPYTGPVTLAAGRHFFQRSAGQGRVAILLARVAEEGFQPQFDVSEKYIKAGRKKS